MARQPRDDSAPATAAVILDAPGVVAVGGYLPGKTYTIPADEAERLVTAKGFRYAESPASPEPPAAEAVAE